MRLTLLKIPILWLFSLSFVYGQEVCNNGIDDDNDGLIDCYDPDCAGNSACSDFFFGQPSPTCTFTPSPSNFLLNEIWTTRGTGNDLDQRATVMVGDIDNDGVPEVVAKEARDGASTSRLYVFDGVTGALETSATVNGNNRFTSLAIGDVDDDGLGEIFFFDNNGRLNRYDYDASTGGLTMTFVSTDAHYSLYTTPELADFNQDGIVEVYAGDIIFSANNGDRLVDGNGVNDANASIGAHIPSDGTSGRQDEPFSVAVDIFSATDVIPETGAPCGGDCDGLELVAGNVVYAINLSTGNLTIISQVSGGALRDGVTSVADMNGDDELDAVVVSEGNVYIWDLRNATQLFSTYSFPSSSNTTKGGRANIADFDLDGSLDIGLAGRSIYVVLETNSGSLTEKWSITSGLLDGSQRTSSTVFDFEGDSKNEVVYSEENSLFILNGEDGTIRSQISSPSGTRFDNPVIVDVNNDGQTEIVVTAQDTPGPSNSQPGYIRVFNSLDQPWINSRSVWNQHNYFITNVNDDLSIPRQQQNYRDIPSSLNGTPYRQVINTFLGQASEYDITGNYIFPAPDITAEINGGATDICQTGTDIPYSFVINNIGDDNCPSGVNIAIFSDDPYTSASPNLLAEITTASVIPDGGNLSISGTITGAPTNLTTLYILINHNNSAATYPLAAGTVVTGIGECDYSNNIVTQSVSQSSPPDNALNVIAAGNIVCTGSSTTITVENAESGVTYQLRRGTTNIGASQVGTGANLNFNTGNLSTDETFNILASSSGGCSSVLTTTQTIQVVDESLTLEAATDAICTGEQTEIRLLNSQSGVTYQLRDASNTIIGSAQAGNGGTIAFNTGSLTVNTTFNILASGGACAGVQLSNTVSVTIIAAPDAGLTVGASTNTICNGQAVNITVANSEIGVSYQLRNDATNANVGVPQVGDGNTLTFVTPAITSTTTFNLLATRSGCTDVELTQTETITVTSANTGLAVDASAISICTGTGTNVTVANSEVGFTYQLRNNDGNVNIGSPVAGTGMTINLPTGNLTATTTFNVLVQQAGCTDEQLTDTQVVTVVANPDLALTVGATSLTICSGSATNVTIANSETGVSYQLQNNATNANIGSPVNGDGNTINLPTGNLTMATTFKVVATRSNCTPQDLNNTVTVNISSPALSNLTVGAAASTICTGTGTNITVANSETGVSYQLQNNATNANIGSPVNGDGNTINLPTGNLTSTTTFKIVASKSGCTDVTLDNTATITVETNPNLGLTITGSTACEDSDATITIEGTESMVSYQAYIGITAVGSPITGTGVDENITIPSASLSVGANTITVKATRGTCIEVDMTDDATVTVIANIDASLAITASPNTVCLGDNTDITISNSDAAVTYQLRDALNNPIGTAQTGNGGDLVFTVTPSADITYNVLATKTNCTDTQMDNTVSITVVNPPNTALVISTDDADNRICETEGGNPNAGLNVIVENSQNGVSYQLVETTGGTDMNIGSAVVGDGSNINLPTGNINGATGTRTYKVVATISPCASVDMDNTVSIELVPDAPAATIVIESDATGNTICAGDVITFQIQSQTNEGTSPTYQWQVNGTDVMGETNTTFTSSTLNDNDEITLVLTPDLECSYPVTSDPIEVTVNPLPTLDINIETDTDQIGCGGEVNIRVDGIETITSVEPNQSVVSINDNNVTVKPTEATTYTITGIDANGCSNTETVDVEAGDINRGVFIPTLFTPNGDGSNETFIIHSNCIDEIELFIFDRSGHQVYYTNDVFQATQVGWDGNAAGNRPQPEGTYSWRIIGTFLNGEPIGDSNKTTGIINLAR